jgi:phosphatidate cytidylyltransferase
MPWSRIFSGIIAIALALGMIVLGGWYFTFGFCVIVYLGLLEYFQLVKAKGIAPAAKITIVVSLLLLFTSAVSPTLTDALFPSSRNVYLFLSAIPAQDGVDCGYASSILGLLYGGYLPSYWVRLRVGWVEASDCLRMLSRVPRTCL